MSGYHIELLKTQTLVPNARNARVHSNKQVKQIAKSIREFGFTNPVLIDDKNGVIAGHGRLLAAQYLGMLEIPCLRLVNLTSGQQRALALADNKLALNAGWDEELLAHELKELFAADVTFDMDITGFSIAEVDSLIESLNVEESGSPRDDVLPCLKPGPAITQLGDVWMLGQHRLICGDALDPEVVKTLMAGEIAQMIFTDPPYNVPIEGHVSGLGNAKHREFAMAAGEMSQEQFTEFLRKVMQNLHDHSTDGSIHFICMDWRHMQEMLRAGEQVYAELKNLIVWVKDNAGMGTFYRSRHELIFAFKKGTAPHSNSFELGQHGRYRTNVWSYKGMNSFGGTRDQDLALHPTIKPVAMIVDAIKDVSNRNGIVLDPFGGSGSTLIAAHKTGRRAFVIELDALYCDLIIRRWQDFAKDDAILLSSGETFGQRLETAVKPRPVAELDT